MNVILATSLGGLLSIILVICLHYATIYIPSLIPYEDSLALLSIFLGLTFATLAARRHKQKKKVKSNDSLIDMDFTTGHSNHANSPSYGGGSGGGAGSARSFFPENINPAAPLHNLSAVSLVNTTDITSGIDASQAAEAASNVTESAINLGQAADLGGELAQAVGEAIGEIVGSILE